MNNEQQSAVDDEAVLSQLGEVPIWFCYIQVKGAGARKERRIDRALQRLRKRGLARHLRKAQGGPGWVKVKP